MQNDPQDPVVDDADGLTVEERAELTADEASGGAPTGAAAQAAPTAPAAPAEAPPTVTPDPRDAALTALAETQAQTAAALAKVTENLDRRQQPEPPATPEPEAPTEPDWDTERKALKQKYDDGDLDDDQFEQAREELLERRAEWRAEQRAAALVNQYREQDQAQAQQRQQEALDRQWESSMQAFMGVEANANLLADPTRVAAFNAVLASVAQEKPNASYSEMLDDARDRTMRAFNMTPPTIITDKQKIADALKNRQATQVPPDLSRAPAAGFDAERGNEFGDLDDLDVDELENRLAHMKEEDVERFLETAPGGLLDNPRS